MNRPQSRAEELHILENTARARAQMNRDCLRFYFRNATISGQPGAYRVHYSQKFFRWPSHTSDAFPTLERVADHLGAASLNCCTGNELKRQRALAVRAVRRFPALLNLR